MSRTLLGELQIFLLLIIGSLAKQTFSNALPLNDGSVVQVRLTDHGIETPHIQYVTISRNSLTTFNVADVSSDASFIIFQFHTYQYNVTLSLDKDHLNKVSNKSVYGTNIGLFHKQTTNITTQYFVKNDNTVTVQAILVAIAYNDKAPIPGGCNMEFNTEIAPYARVQRRNGMVLVDVQPAAVPSRNGSRPICEKNPVKLEMYQMFLTEQDFSVNSYFTAIVNMLTVKSIRENGVEVLEILPLIISPAPVPSLRRVFSAYPGVGSVYVAVAIHDMGTAAYVPTFSYACDPLIDPDSCQVLHYTSSKIVCALCFFVGMLLVYLGHLYPPIDMGWPIFFIGTVIGYILNGGGIGIGILIGISITVLWMLSQYLLPLVGTVIFSLPLGLFFSCVFYFHAPDTLVILHSDWVFWMLFVTITICIALVSILLCFCGSIITCCIFSSFAIILPLDYYFGSCLKYILINTVRRITVEDFNLASVRAPTQTTDIVLIVLWILLALFRLWRQLSGGLSGYTAL